MSESFVYISNCSDTDIKEMKNGRLVCPEYFGEILFSTQDVLNAIRYFRNDFIKSGIDRKFISKASLVNSYWIHTGIKKSLISAITK